MRRVYHHYERLEEYHCGMWRMVKGEDRPPLRQAAADLMKRPDLFRDAMLRAITGWRFSCEHNLTSRATNRIAWLGHAGCCLATTAPEDVTREAWWTLTQVQQDVANRVAADVLAEWEQRYGEAQERRTETTA